MSTTSGTTLSGLGDAATDLGVSVVDLGDS